MIADAQMAEFVYEYRLCASWWAFRKSRVHANPTCARGAGSPASLHAAYGYVCGSSVHYLLAGRQDFGDSLKELLLEPGLYRGGSFLRVPLVTDN